MSRISAKTLIDQINAKTAPLILDVRSKREFDQGHVPGARHIPFWKMSAQAETLSAFRERPIVVYCGHGPRAYIAGTALRRRGFKQVAYLAGHMKKWKSMRLPLVVALLLALTSASPFGQQQADVRMVGVEGEGAKYWPVWRGPSGQGLVVGNSYRDTWSATEGVLWKKAVPGRGNSSPIVWGDSIFLTTAYDGGRRLSLVAFRRSDGTQLWEAFAPDGRPANAHYKNGHASATPATDGSMVYVSFGSRGLAAFTFDGKLAWHQDLGPVDNYHGAAGSPLLYKNRVILFQDHGRGAFVAAFDTRSGKQLWRTPREAYVGWGTPVAVRVGTHDEIIVSSQGAVTAYHPDTGAELWRCDGNSYEVIPTPVVSHGLVIASSGRVGPTLAIRPGGKGNVTRTHLAWASPKGSPFVPSPIVYGDYLYICNDNGVLTVYDAKSGAQVYVHRIGTTNSTFSASPIAGRGQLYFASEDGEVFVIKAGPIYELLATNQMGEPLMATPAVSDGIILFRSQRQILAVK